MFLKTGYRMVEVQIELMNYRDNENKTPAFQARGHLWEHLTVIKSRFYLIS